MLKGGRMAGDKPGENRVLAGGATYIDFQTDPSRYRIGSSMSPAVATLTMDVDENAGCSRAISSSSIPTTLAVDIELADAVAAATL